MGDERLRQLERRWLETKALDDEAGLLTERVRSGVLLRERLELAAFCGHPAACAALGTEQPEVPEDLEAWGDAFARWGRESCVRAMIAAARRVLPCWSVFRAHDHRPLRAIELAEEWIRTPSTERELDAWSYGAQALWGLHEEVVSFVSSDAGVGDRAAAALASHALTACSFVCRFTNAHREPSLDIGGALKIASGALGEEGPDEAAIHAAIADDVIPWAAGYRDPVLTRLADRGLRDRRG